MRHSGFKLQKRARPSSSGNSNLQAPLLFTALFLEGPWFQLWTAVVKLVDLTETPFVRGPQGLCYGWVGLATRVNRSLLCPWHVAPHTTVWEQLVKVGELKIGEAGASPTVQNISEIREATAQAGNYSCTSCWWRLHSCFSVVFWSRV